MEPCRAKEDEPPASATSTFGGADGLAQREGSRKNERRLGPVEKIEAPLTAVKPTRPHA